MINRVFRILFVLLCLHTGFAMAGETAEAEEEFLSGRELLHGCEEGAAPGAPNQYCMQYVFGFVQTVVALQAADPSQPELFCIAPTKIRLEEVTDNVTRWLRNQPERLDEDAYLLVGQSLATDYPCQASAF
ncbi:MAG: hypothetical protein MI865_08890 [Proteobacteria bacterium]|nr:hypothetical protein [Pseudomonadota bacterium]